MKRHRGKSRSNWSVGIQFCKKCGLTPAYCKCDLTLLPQLLERLRASNLRNKNLVKCPTCRGSGYDDGLSCNDCHGLGYGTR